MSADLDKEFETLVAIDHERNQHNAALQKLQSRRDMQIGRMQVIAEQDEIDLEAYVTEKLQQA